jgi:sterol desaturase/sphingolipid hydroxylase (fatty acid hydroxylase superfamily)
LLLAIGVFATLGLLVGTLFGPNIGYLTNAIWISYYLGYEWIHLIAHQPEDIWSSNLPGIAWLRKHHQRHHADPTSSGNYNVLFPFSDLCLGTILADHCGRKS